MISRIIVYTLLLCMILLTAYQYHNRKVTEKSLREATTLTSPKIRSRRQATANVPTEQQAVTSQEDYASDAPDSSPAVATTTSRAEDGQKDLKERAFGLLRKKDWSGALELLGEIDNPDTEVLLGTGICYFRLGDYQNSVSLLRRVISQDRVNFVALKIIAFAYYRLGNMDDSFDMARKGLSVRDDAQLRALYDRLVRERKARQDYAEEDSSHFRILYDGYKQGNIDREILDILEDAYRTIGQDLDYFPSEPVTVVLYTDRDFYDTTLAPHWSNGLYDGKIRIPVKGIDFQRPVVRKVLFHEYTHVLVHYIAHSCPLWINEGLAEYFSTRYPGTTGQVIPLRDMEKSFAGFNDSYVALAYRESYSAVSFLINKYGLYRMKEVLEGFGAGKGADAAFEDALGITYSQFVSSWGKVRNSSF